MQPRTEKGRKNANPTDLYRSRSESSVASLVGWLVGRWNSANLCRGSTCHRISSRLDEKFIAVSSDDNDRKIYALVNLSTPSIRNSRVVERKMQEEEIYYLSLFESFGKDS